MKGRIAVEMVDGCPEVSRREAEELIEEIEEKVSARRVWDIGAKGAVPTETEKKVQCQVEREWMRSLMENHEVFQGLPEEIKERVLELPATDWSSLPWNRRRRRQQGSGQKVTLHLYAGPDEGYTFRRAFKEVGGDARNIMEVDILRGPREDMVEGGLYAGLLRLCFDWEVGMVMGGPNCRTRSVLRHYPIPDLPGGGPRPLRGMAREEQFGFEYLEPWERKQVVEDDVMMWRMIMLYLVADEVAMRKREEPVGFLVEQPADPSHYQPECVSWWRTPQWRGLREDKWLLEVTFNQGDYGGVAVKPTTLGTNLVVQLPQEKVEGLGTRGTATAVDFKETKNMARWVPGLMREIATDVLEQIYKEKAEVKRLSWGEHVANGHVPFRKDCRDCQLASAKDRPHRRIKHPQAYVLSLDVAGPMKRGWDIDGKACKYLLVGAYTWAKPGQPGVEEEEDKGEGRKAGEAKEDQEADKEEEIPKMEDYWTMSSDGSAVIRVHKHHRKVRFFPGDAEGCPVPVDKLESVRKTVARKTKGGAYTVHEDDWKSARREDQLFEDGSRWAGRTIFKVEGVEPEQRLEEGDQELPAGEEPLPEGDWDFELEDVGGELREAGDDPAPEEGQELEDEGPEGLEVETHWMALPMPTKSIPSVTEAVQEMYLALRADGYPVARMHTDKGREFQNHTLKKWCGNRDIWKTSTAGDNFKANGRVEVTIQKIKSRMRRVLHAAELDGEWWPCAARYVQAKDKMIRNREEGTIPAFGQEVLFKRRKWKVKDDMEVTHQNHTTWRRSATFLTGMRS